jgi:hypothetical protein
MVLFYNPLGIDKVSKALWELIIPLQTTISCCKEIQADPVESCSDRVSTGSTDILHSCDNEPYNGFILMKCKKLDDNHLVF